MKKTIRQQAIEANGRSRACDKCIHAKSMRPSICKVCRNAFMEGYLKGWKQAIVELKDKSK